MKPNSNNLSNFDLRDNTVYDYLSDTTFVSLFENGFPLQWGNEGSLWIKFSDHFLIETFYITPPLGGPQKIRKIIEAKESYYKLREEEVNTLFYRLHQFLVKTSRKVREIGFNWQEEKPLQFYFRKPRVIDVHWDENKIIIPFSSPEEFKTFHELYFYETPPEETSGLAFEIARLNYIILQY